MPDMPDMSVRVLLMSGKGLWPCRIFCPAGFNICRLWTEKNVWQGIKMSDRALKTCRTFCGRPEIIFARTGCGEFVPNKKKNGHFKLFYIFPSDLLEKGTSFFPKCRQIIRILTHCLTKTNSVSFFFSTDIGQRDDFYLFKNVFPSNEAKHTLGWPRRPNNIWMSLS